MIYNSSLKWDKVYDVIVVGFGGAGAGAARFAADNGAHVLLVDSAPEGSEGGNTRYAGGLGCPVPRSWGRRALPWGGCF